MRHRFLAPALLLAVAAAAPVLTAQAESFASSASSAGSASSGSVSDSLETSSESSSGDKKVAEGQYRVQAVAQAPGRPGQLRVQLRPEAGQPGEPFALILPERAITGQPLRAGDVITARQRAYGFEFARVQAREPFFLVLHDDWQREMQSHVVTL